MTASATRAVLLLALALWTSASVATAQDESLRQAVDRQLPPTAGLTVSCCTDAEFLRRVSLDLIGLPPSADDTRAFLTDTAVDKRERLIDRLTSSPHFDRHLATVLDVWLMERRANQQVTQDEWQAWLLASVRANKPWNILVREILTADGGDPAHRAPARFALDRGAESHVVARDVGRIFFGRDMQCAQCHDHPLIPDYHQADYHGLLAFAATGAAVAVTQGDKDVTVYAERAGSDLPFESVFIKGVPHRTGPRLPDGTEIAEPFFLPGEEYEVAPADKVRSVPKFSRRATLAELTTDGTHRFFNENIANRLWAHMMGRGLVHPVDMHHSSNPPTNPQLLTLLGERFAAMNFDMRAFLRELALTEVYQRSIDMPADPLAAASHAQTLVDEAEIARTQIESTLAASTSTYDAAYAAWNAVEAGLIPVATEYETARTQYTEAKKTRDAAAQAVSEATAALAGKQAVAAPLQLAATAASEAAAKLPDDAEITAAAQKFTERAAQLAAEVVALQTALDEKAAALVAPQQALDAAKLALETAHEKVEPLRVAIRQQEAVMLDARRVMTADATRLAALEERLFMLRQLAQLPEFQQATVTAESAVPMRENERTAAIALVTEQTALVAERTTAVNEATTVQTAMQTALEQATAEHQQRTENVKLVAEVSAAAEKAHQLLPDDAVLADAAQKLKTRATELETVLVESEQAVAQTQSALDAAALALVTATTMQTEAVAEQSRREQAVIAATAAVEQSVADVASAQANFENELSELRDRWTKDSTLAALKPLTPEQMCWSVFQVTGVYRSYWNAEAAELEKTAPLTPEQQQDPVAVAARNAEIEQRTFDKLKSYVGTYVSMYGAAAGQPQSDFFATADQALFAANATMINSWVVPSGDNVTQRMVNATEPAQAAEELYLGILSRMPTEEETADVTARLANRTDDRAVAAAELAWGLINSAEFRFNH